MKMFIDRDALRKIKPAAKAFDVVDTRLPGFCVRIMPSGKIYYGIRYTDKDTGKQYRYSLKLSFPQTSPSEARAAATIRLGEIEAGNNPAVARKAASKRRISLLDFIDKHYADYLRNKTKDHAETIRRLKKSFSSFLDTPLAQINALSIEKWRTDRISAGIQRVTVNRDIGALRPVFSRAVEWKFIDEHPLKSVKALKITTDPIVRFLSDAEETRLRTALDEREARVRAARARANIWRAARRYNLLPELDESEFVDYLKPAVLLSINTGIRQGELVQLQWSDVDLPNAWLAVRGEYAKSGKLRHVPLNAEAMSVLTQWKRQRGASLLVFPSRDGQPIAEIKTAWRKLMADAGISDFRWHDMRHHFASRLVMSDVDLNTVRELLGHADLKMTLRYAHLAPEHKAAAVQKLMRATAVENPSRKEPA